MCLGVPGKVLETAESVWGTAKVEIGGVTRDVSLQLTPDATVGDWVLVHAGFAIQQIDEEEAADTLRLLDEISGGVAMDIVDLENLPQSEPA
jgi:hydrogenase expression/formation protein HypC